MISAMCPDIGGVCFPAAPFNGWSMCAEIGSRDLGDMCCCDQLAVIARHVGLSTASVRALWKDRADWTWIVAPADPSATRVFHRHDQDFGQTPSFCRQGDASHQRTCARGFGS